MKNSCTNSLSWFERNWFKSCKANQQACPNTITCIFAQDVGMLGPSTTRTWLVGSANMTRALSLNTLQKRIVVVGWRLKKMGVIGERKSESQTCSRIISQRTNNWQNRSRSLLVVFLLTWTIENKPWANYSLNSREIINEQQVREQNGIGTTSDPQLRLNMIRRGEFSTKGRFNAFLWIRRNLNACMSQ